MARKKERKLTELQYYKWRLSIEMMKHKETQKSLIESQSRAKELEIQNLVLKSNIFRNKIIQSSQELEAYKKEYDTIKEGIESELGFSLTNCIIDEVTFEVKDIE